MPTTTPADHAPAAAQGEHDATPDKTSWGSAPLASHCPNCGSRVEGGGRGLGRIFCKAACRLDFNARQKARGAVLAPMLLAEKLLRHAPAGSEDAELRSTIAKEVTEIAKFFNDEDREAGRPSAAAYARAVLSQGFRYCDRRRK